VFLWLGPRLSIAPVVNSLSSRLNAIAGASAEKSAAIFEQNLAEILESYNFFSALSTWPLGVPSLLAGSSSSGSPLGRPDSILVDTVSELGLWLLTLVLFGLLIGTLYLSLIARWARENPARLLTWFRRTCIQWARILLFVALVLLGTFVVSLPFFLTVEVLAMAFAPLASLALVVGVGLGMWVLFHLFFATHSILMDEAGIASAAHRSVRLVRRYRLSAVGLLVVAVLISLGLSTIWNIPPSQSWMRLAAIVGNAFVNTGLAAATFVYYRERAADGEGAQAPTR
jgi:hypothetical protein